MRYAVILAGGAGTRLWPMSQSGRPKQLIPLLEGKSLLGMAFDRLEGLIPLGNRYVCAAAEHEEAILSGIAGLDRRRFLGEPEGRDTLAAVGLAAAVLAAEDPEAVIGVFTADHLIEPVERFQAVVEEGFALAERMPEVLVTFGIIPTEPATSFGYLELGRPLEGGGKVVDRFAEKPPADLAREYFQEGPQRWLWNSGMFVWRASTLLDCIGRYKPAVLAGLQTVAQHWHDAAPPQGARRGVFHAGADQRRFRGDGAGRGRPGGHGGGHSHAGRWLNVGSWPAFARTCPRDEHGKRPGRGRHLLLDTSNCLVVSDDADHLVATIGCRDLIVVHTAAATLVCPADQAERIKELCKLVEAQFGSGYA